MSLSHTAPSPFAALLRRSKFATYDQAIGQVYTTHGGHAFRGDWGFKRPLANRRRPGFVTVRSVDSAEQQTEWNSAESSARWMRRWEELGKNLEVNEMAPWRSKISPSAWRIDTEFDSTQDRRTPYRKKSTEDDTQLDGLDSTSNLKAKTSNQSKNYHAELYALDSVPNPEAMSPKQFQKYLEWLRALRPEFKTFLREYWRERQEMLQKQGSRPQLRSEKEQLLFTGSGDVQMLFSAQNAPQKIVFEFLRRQAEHDLISSTSTRIEQRPHPLAGLEYTRMSTLQSKYLHKPVPGRHIGTNRAARYQNADHKQKYDLIAVGGIVGSADTGSHNMVPTDFGTRETPRTDRERGKGLFRMSKVSLENPPQTVGRRPQGATATKLQEVIFRVAKTSNLSNPHPLGSPEYVAQSSDVALKKGGWDHHPIPSSYTSLTRRVLVPPPRDEAMEHAQSKDLVAKLSNMVRNPGSRGGTTSKGSS